jgi:uncharacterized protein (DUF1330 family)
LSKQNIAMDNKITLIVKATVNPEEMNSFNAYIQNLMDFYQKANVEQIGQYLIKETYFGDDLPTFIAVFTFPNRQTFNSIYESLEYKQTMVPLREKGFKKLEVFLS